MVIQTIQIIVKLSRAGERQRPLRASPGFTFSLTLVVRHGVDISPQMIYMGLEGDRFSINPQTAACIANQKCEA